MIKRILALLAAVLFTVGVGVAVPSPAQATTKTVTRVCPFPGVADRSVKITWDRTGSFEGPVRVDFLDGGTFGASMAYALVTLDFTEVNVGIIRREQHNVPSTASNNAIGWPWAGPSVQWTNRGQLDMVVTVAGALGGGHCQVRVPDAW
jgi:hypothetical protein